MKIKVELKPKSIQEAIKKLQKAKYQSTKGNVIKEYLEYICEWIINKANWYLDNADLGELVKLQIRNAWQYDISGNGAKIRNNATMIKRVGGQTEIVPTAVLVEFGVGIVGQQNKHPNSILAGYEYDLESSAKFENGAWGFYTNEEDLDLPQSALVSKITFDTDHKRGRKGEGGYRLYVSTRGTEGVMYLYNAIVDARNELEKPNGVFAQEYNRLLERYVR